MKAHQSISARFVAIDSLARLKQSKKPLSDIVDELVIKQRINDQELRLAHEIMFRVLRHYQYLDHILRGFLKKPINKLHPLVHQGLRVGLAQILFLDGIPPFAAVDETIKALKRLRLRHQLTGLVNGVLRSVIRNLDDIPTEEKLEDILNHPRWLTDRWRKQFGQGEMIRICHSNNRRPKLGLLVNRLVTDRTALLERFNANGIEAEKGNFSNNTLLLSDFKGNISQLPGFDQGAFLVQDQGAQLISLLLFPLAQNGRYLDGCAGLGGKTAHLVQQGREKQVEVFAVEPQNRRYRQLLENLKRLGHTTLVTSSHQTIEDFAAGSSLLFDGVLLDVPCSGTGVIGRRPDIRWNRQQSDLAQYRRTQIEILQCGARLVRPGGVLVYATCSLEPEENMDVINRFLQHNERFQLQDCRDCLPESCHRFIRAGCLQTIPDGSMDGFFAAKLIRKH